MSFREGSAEMPRGADSWHQGSCDGSSCRAGRVTDKNGERVSPPPGLCKAEPATTATCGSLPAVLTPALLSLCHCHHIRSVHSSSWWGGGGQKLVLFSPLQVWGQGQGLGLAGMSERAVPKNMAPKSAPCQLAGQRAVLLLWSVGRPHGTAMQPQ